MNGHSKKRFLQLLEVMKTSLSMCLAIHGCVPSFFLQSISQAEVPSFRHKRPNIFTCAVVSAETRVNPSPFGLQWGLLHV